MNNGSNHVSNTALIVALGNMHSGIQYAWEIAVIREAEAEIYKAFVKCGYGAYFDAARKVFEAMLPLRHLALSRAIENVGYINLLEFASGYDPRGTIFAGDPRQHVVETDLSGMIRIKQALIKQLVGLRPNHRFIAADATSAISICRTTKLLPEGPIAMACAGLLAYLPDEKKNAFIGSVKQVIRRRPGSVLFATSQDFITTHDMKTWREGELGRALFAVMAHLSGQDFYPFPDTAAIEDFLRGHGLSYNRRKQLDLVPGYGQSLEPGLQEKLSSGEIWTIGQFV